MYMVYGSWSGGLFILETDPRTGRVLYPGKDSVEEISGNYIDRYYGCHIAGANHESGEGPYILYDEEAGYGPYVDAAGGNAADNGVDNFKYGIKLIGNYAFTDQRGYRAAGHNSALIDGDGNRYLVYHQRFDEATEYHEVRVHQQFLNEDQWPVTAVYENRNETIANVTEEQAAGSYELINHSTGNETHMLKTQSVTLQPDGTVSGDLTGSWKKTDSQKGYDYVTIEAGDLIYKGIFFEQTDDSNEKVMTFSAIGNDNTCIWGSK